jgi:hypothetical protein
VDPILNQSYLRIFFEELGTGKCEEIGMKLTTGCFKLEKSGWN